MSFKHNFIRAQRKLHSKEIIQRTDKALAINTTEEHHSSNHNTMVSSIPSQKTKLRKKFPFPPLLPSQKEKYRLAKLDEDILYAEHFKDVLDIYIENKTSFEPGHYISTVKKLAKLFKNGNVSIDLHENSTFQSICYDIWKKTSHFEAHHVITLYKNFQLLEINSEYLLMQALLQMMRRQINIIQLPDLIDMYKLIEKTAPSNLKNALELAIPRAIESRINSYFPDILKFKKTIELLRICVIGKVRGVNCVLKLLYDQHLPRLKRKNFLDSTLIFLLDNVLKIIKTESTDCIYSEEELEISKNLAQICLNELSILDLSNVEKDLILNILDNLGTVFCTNQNNYASHEEFLANVVGNCLSEKWDTISICKVIHYQLKLERVNDDLVSLAVGCLTEDISGLSDQCLVSVILALACGDTHSQEREKIVRSLMENFTLPTENFEVSWLKFALNLLSMNYYPESLLKTVLNETYLRRYFDYRSDTQEYIHLLKLDRALKAFDWNFDNRIPTELLDYAKEKYFESRPTPSLRPLLEKFVGKQRCLSDIITPQKNDLDHLIILNEDGRPIQFGFSDIGFESMELDDLSKFTGKRKIGFVEVPEEWTYKSDSKLKGHFKLELQLLEKEGFEICPLYECQIETLEPEGLLIYFKEKLKNIGCNLNL